MKIGIVASKGFTQEFIFELSVSLEDTLFSFRWFEKLSQYAKSAMSIEYDVLIVPYTFDQQRFYDSLYQNVKVVIFVNADTFIQKRFGKTQLIYFSNDWKQELSICLPVLKQCAKGKQFYLIHAQGMSMQIRLRDIYYVEKQDKNLLFHTRFGIFKERGALYEKEELWKEDGFVRIHHSILLNLRSLKQLIGNEVILNNQECLPVSRSRKQELQKKLQVFHPDHTS